MRFEQPLVLILILTLPYFIYLGRPTGRYDRGRRWTALVLRCLIVGLVILSLAGMQSVHGSDTLATVFLVDVSDSVPEAEQTRALSFVEEALATMGPDDRAAVILFGADALVERPMMAGGELGPVASVPRTYQTDLEGAIRLGMALFPSGAARRMVILSDGRPTVGQADRVVRLAAAQSIRVDVVPLTGAAWSADSEQMPGEAWLTEVEAPKWVHQGETFSIEVTARSSVDMDALLTVLSEERVIARQTVHLNPGENTFSLSATAERSGFLTFRVHLDPLLDLYPQNNVLSTFTMVSGAPRVLLVAPPSESGEEADVGTYLQRALEAGGMLVARSTPGAMPYDPSGLAEYAVVILVDTPAQMMSPRAMRALQSYVRDLGGGLVAVGGSHAYGVGGWYQTPLEETLPVEMTVHDQERFPPMAIVVVIDKSGSMSVTENGIQKIRLAGEAAARVAELITDQDEIMVIAFDDRPADVIGPLPGSQRDEAVERAIRLQAGGGGIYVRESLEEALRYLADSDKTIRHIILLADGADSEHQEGVRELVTEQIAAENITLSTVAIGAGTDLDFLEEIAGLGNGRYHFTDQAATLPVIFAQETQLAMRSYIVEEPFYPHQTANSPILAGIEAVPQLAGYVATTPKSAAQVVLTTHQDDPLLATWQYGLGRAVAWTSDATGRWAQAWVRWEGFSHFWAQAVRWAIVEQSDTPVEMNVSLEGKGEEARLVVDVADTSGEFVNGLTAQVHLVTPGGEAYTLDLTQTAPGRYEGTFVPEEQGAYLMRLTGSLDGQESVGLTTGWVMSYPPEYAALEGDPRYLSALAEAGGGAVLESPADAFAHTVRGSGTRRDLWPYLLGLATLLFPFDVGVRRLVLTHRDWVRMREWIRAHVRRRRRTVTTEEAPAASPVGRLFQAKARVEERQPKPIAIATEGVDLAPLEPSTPPSPPPLPEEEKSRSAPPPPPVPSPQKAEPPPPPPTVSEGETLAGRLLQRRRSRRDTRQNRS